MRCDAWAVQEQYKGRWSQSAFPWSSGPIIRERSPETGGDQPSSVLVLSSVTVASGSLLSFYEPAFFVLCLLVPSAIPFSTGLMPSQALSLFLYKGFRKLALGARKAGAWTVQMIFACFLFLQLMKLSFHLNAITVWSVNINRGSVAICNCLRLLCILGRLSIWDRMIRHITTTE